MEEYYRKVAEEYERVYHRKDPVWQEEIRQIAERLKDTFKSKRVLEIACGTGYWTQILSETAQSVVATDIVLKMLEITKRKQYKCSISFIKEDAYALPFVNGSFDGGLANFWFSHVPKKKIDSFLEEFHRVLQNRAKVFLADNVYVPRIGGRLVSKPGDENTYKLRRLENGSEHLVLKNYFKVQDLMNIFGNLARKFTRESVFYGSYYWYVVYEPQ